MICLISFSKFSDMLPAFTCPRAIGNLSSICLGVNFFNPLPCVDFIEEIPLLKTLRVNLHLHKEYLHYQKYFVFYP